MTRNEIELFLHNMEVERNIKILLAVDAGSRSYGYSSPQSDTDVRFIYVEKPLYYYSILNQPDTIEYMSGDHTLDVVGFNLKKALGLIAKTNPEISDWLHSESAYIKDDAFVSKMVEIETNYYNPKSAMYNYYAIGVKTNMQKLFADQTLKRFIYYMRCILACMWIEQYGTHPEVVLDKLIDNILPDPSLREKAHAILIQKRISKSHDDDTVDSELWEYFHKQQLRYAELLPTLQVNKMQVDNMELSNFLMETVEKINVRCNDRR